MKRILITDSFLKILRKYRRNFNEEDVVINVKEFVRIGFRKGESKLKTVISGDVTTDIVKSASVFDSRQGVI